MGEAASPLIILGAVWTFFVILIAWNAFMLHRTKWVGENRIALIEEAGRRSQVEIASGTLGQWDRFYDALPSHDDMMRRWWIWDASKFMEWPE